MLTIRPAIDVSLDQLLLLWNSAFADYVTGPVSFTPASMAQFLYLSNINLNISLVAFVDDALAGVGMVSRQGWTVRLAGMGIGAAFQGQGVGKYLLDQLLDQARVRGDHKYLLEAFEQNVRAVRLYEKAGFHITAQLLGYSAEYLAGESDAALTEIDIMEAVHMIMQHGDPDLPWQVSATHIARFGPPAVAYRLDHAAAVISSPDAASIRILALIVAPEYQRRGEGSRLLQALAARHAGKTWFIPQLCPAQFGGFLTKNGFTRDSLNQVQMELSLR